jgi:hypothetical protein
MWESKERETAGDVPQTQTPDRLLRHYRKIGAPAVAAALHVGTGRFPRETGERAQAETARAAPGFLFADDHAA